MILPVLLLLLLAEGVAYGQTGCTYTVTPSTASVPAAATAVPLTVTTGPTCVWSASNSNPWIQVSSSPRIGTGPIVAQVARHDGASGRSGGFTIANRTITIAQAPCLYSVTQQGTTGTMLLPHEGGQRELTPAGTPGCTMTPSGPPWVSFAPSAQLGGYLVNVSANPTFANRSGFITFPTGQSIELFQWARPCTIAVTPRVMNVSVPNSGVNFSFAVTASDPQCEWTFSGPAGFSITGGAPAGDRVETRRVGNSVVTGSTPPTTSLTDPWQLVALTASGILNPVGVDINKFSVAPSRTLFHADGGDFDLNFAASCVSSFCTYGAPANPSWIQNIPPIFSFRVLPNTSTANRTYEMPLHVTNVPATSVTITQLGICNFTRSPATIDVGGDGGAVEFMMTAPDSRCPWTVAPSDSSIRLNSTTGTGTALIVGTMDANPSSSPRTASVQITSPGAMLTTVRVNQAGQSCEPKITTAGGTVPASGGSRTVSVAIALGCAWQATVSQPWLTLAGASNGNVPGSFAVNVAANTEPVTRAALVTVSGKTLTITQDAGSCTYTLSSNSISVPAAGQQGSVNLTASAGCNWTAASPDPFVTITTGASGSGNGTVSFNVLANQNASARATTLTIAGRSYTVNQAGLSCTYTLSPTTATVPSSGGARTFSVETSAGCAWQAIASEPWISFPGASSGTGPGSFSITAAANSGSSARTGSVSAGGRTSTITQEGGACTYTLSSTSISIPAAGEQNSVNVTTSAGCNWTAASPDSWAVITAGASGSGNGTVSFNVLANPGASSRSTTLTIAGRSYTVSQAGTAAGPPGTGLTFVSLPPCRILETRPEYNFEGRTGAFGPPFLARGETRTLQMNQSNLCPVPTSAKAYVVNVTLVPRGAVDFATLWPAGETRPNVWSIRSPDGNIVANSAIIKAGTGGAIQLHVSDNTDLLIDIAGYFTDNRSLSNLAYYPLTPCRVIETRSEYRPAGPFGPPSLSARQTRRFRFPASSCPVPQGASAYSMTITAVPQGALQFLTAWPAGATQPNVSSINSPAGRVLANSVILPAGSDGSIDVFAFDQTDFLIDITGYFAPDDGTNGQFYFPVTQCRASDSTVSGGIFTDESVRTLNVPGAAGCSNIPSSARGYALNVTALPGGQPMPFVTLYPTGQSRPNASVLNAFNGQIVTNSSIVPAGPGGSIEIFAFRRTNLVVEINGYFGR